MAAGWRSSAIAAITASSRVYDFDSKALRYMDPSVDRDSQPVWSPDGKQIAFMRSAVGRRRPRRTARGAIPGRSAWRAWRTATGRQIWRADAGPGSVFHPVVTEQPTLLGARAIASCSHGRRTAGRIFTRSRWRAGAATLLTPGNFEVEHVAFSDDRKEAVFSSNQDDIDRRHIWRVAIAGGKPRAVTSGESLEWEPVFARRRRRFPACGCAQPARAAIQTGTAAKDLAPESVPADFPADSLVVPQQVIYPASDGMPIHGQLFLPADWKAREKRPALVFMHGGSRRQMLLGWHYMDYYNNAYAMNQYLASQGYIVLSINYRSGIGYGLNFREAINYGASGASEYTTCEGAALYLRTRADVDPAHIGLWGGSYGGYLTAMGLARGSDLFAAGVDFHGVHDWSARMRAGGRAGAAADDATRTAFESSPMASVRTWRSPVLLIHGDDDRNVDFSADGGTRGGAAPAGGLLRAVDHSR